MASTITALTGGGGVAVAGDTSGVLELKTNNGTTALTLDTSQNATVAGNVVSSSFNSASTFGFKNRIINGAMMIDQRNAGASVTPAGGATTYTVDRFSIYASQASKLTAQQTTTAPAGFLNSLKVTSSSAYSVLASDVFVFQQAIEGLNVADLGWGTANAQTVTLSFRVYSSLTGTFGGAILNSAQTRSYPFSYSIPVANTWTTISITIAGDTSGTWLTTNGIGLTIAWSMGTGSTYTGTAGSWAGTNYYTSTGATSVVGTNGATWYITGVQLEKGSTATSFDYRPYGTELALCQRYYETGSYIYTGGYSNSAVVASVVTPVYFKVTKRISPTVTGTNDQGTFSVSTITVDGCACGRSTVVANRINNGTFIAEAEL